MTECRWITEVEKWFDGESADPQEVERHVDQCHACAAQLERLRLIRDGVEAVVERGTIDDPQLPAFMAGIRDRIDRPMRRRRGVWALASAAAAAIVMVAGFNVLMDRPPESLVTEVESFATELDGATVTTYLSDDGTATVWVSLPKEEVW